MKHFLILYLQCPYNDSMHLYRAALINDSAGVVATKIIALVNLIKVFIKNQTINIFIKIFIYKILLVVN